MKFFLVVATVALLCIALGEANPQFQWWPWGGSNGQNGNSRRPSFPWSDWLPQIGNRGGNSAAGSTADSSVPNSPAPSTSQAAAGGASSTSPATGGASSTSPAGDTSSPTA